MTTPAQQTEKALIVQIEPWIDKSELRELERVIDSTFVVEHELTREFECMTEKLTGCNHAIAVCNGTMALFVGLKALGIGPGDEVIVPNFTFIASANAVILAGATPVLCEVREDSFCLDVAKAEQSVTPRTKSVMPVHLYGQSADMDEVMAFAKRHGLSVIEDAAEAIGVRFAGKHVGTFGDVGILSYYGNKTVTCGEGGMVLTNNEPEKLRSRPEGHFCSRIDWVQFLVHGFAGCCGDRPNEEDARHRSQEAGDPRSIRRGVARSAGFPAGLHRFTL